VFGFAIAGKRGSKYFKPSMGDVVDTRERQANLQIAFNSKVDVQATNKTTRRHKPHGTNKPK